jgi:hypothetical protein
VIDKCQSVREKSAATLLKADRVCEHADDIIGSTQQIDDKLAYINSLFGKKQASADGTSGIKRTKTRKSN